MAEKDQQMMREKFTYILVDLMCIIFPLVFSFHPKIKFYKQWRYFLAPCIATALLFLVWDALFTRAGIWSFNSVYTIGIYLFRLPLEEYLFFLCVPYACVFTYYCISLFFKLSSFNKTANIVTYILISFLVIFALFHLTQLYTSLTFIFLASFLFFILLGKKTFLPAFYLAFFIILIPFLISNGILTGTGLSQPVVLYNDNYNSRIRILTIPFEDTFYGMLLILMNVTGFDYLANKRFKKSYTIT